MCYLENLNIESLKKLYIKILIALIKRNVVTNFEYGEGYDKSAETYERWISLMGKYIKPLISGERFDDNSTIIDFVCSTGFISIELINEGYVGKIIGVDISRDMLKRCSDIESDRVRFHQYDAVEYIESLILNGNHVDGIFLGWAYPYTNHKRLLGIVYKILELEGYFIFISNCSGMLRNIEKRMLNVMADHLESVEKPMEARIKLPAGSDEFKSRIEKK